MKLHNSNITASNARTTAAEIKPKVRCGIYARKSTDEEDASFRSTDAQVEYCTKYTEFQALEGWELSETYIDSGFSGGNTNRPGLKRLLADVKDGLIDAVVVHRLDRFSRSLTDFVKMWEILEEYKVGFVSITERFDTNTPTGKLMMRILITFAEFIRESNIEHLKSKITASKQKGMWLGGAPPLGYKAVDKKLIINELEAETILLLFAKFIETKSIKLVAGLLREKGLKTKQYTYKNKKTGHERLVGGNDFSHKTLYEIINNVIYNGKVSHKGVIYPGLHQAIISDEIWDAAHRVMAIRARVRSGAAKRKVQNLLSGVLECGCCGVAMTPTYTKKANGKIYRYYNGHINGRGAGCECKQVSAPEIEAVVLGQLRQVFREPELIVSAWRNVNGNISDESSDVSEERVREMLNSISGVLGELFPAEQERLVRIMLEKVAMRKDSVELGIKTSGLMTLIQETQNADGAKLLASGALAGGAVGAGALAAGNSDSVLSVKVPFQIKQNGVRKLITLPEGASAAKPKYKPDKALVNALVKGYVLQKQIDEGKVKNANALAKKHGRDSSYVYQALRMNSLAPRIKEAILDGTQPRGMNMEMMKKPWPEGWEGQRRHFGFVAESGDGLANCESKESRAA